MARDTDAVIIAGNGGLYTGPVGTLLPTDVATPLATVDPDWIEAGWISEEGASLSVSKDKEPINVWQQPEAIGYSVTGSSTEVGLTLRQWDENTIRLAFGGGTIEETSVGSGVYRYEPPGPEALDYRAVVLEWFVGTYAFRFIAPRTLITEGVETTFARSTPSDLPIRLGVLGTSGVTSWTIYTNHPSWAPAA